MNYTELKKWMQERSEYLTLLRDQVVDTTSFEYAKLTGQIISLYEAIIKVQEMEIDDLTNKEVSQDV